MPDYKSMYLSLFNSITNAIEILKEAQLKSELAYIDSSNEPTLTVLNCNINSQQGSNQNQE